ncbi:unnamed protein product [Cuscuta epithymum]|uniref:Uncharacterized protein n=1 Tax=Cuscuta epithymum TaxID=186058 RepID=A0AAV0CFL5_9ASTE|nr:unnamed protein product [Cuscuta epithymum]
MLHSLYKQIKVDGKENRLTGVDVNSDGDEENRDDAEEDDGVDHNGSPAGMHTPELNHLVPARNLEEQPRSEEHEEHHRYHHRPPIRHLDLRRFDFSRSAPIQLLFAGHSAPTTTLKYRKL